jgi:hypothetical protein
MCYGNELHIYSEFNLKVSENVAHTERPKMFNKVNINIIHIAPWKFTMFLHSSMYSYIGTTEI